MSSTTQKKGWFVAGIIFFILAILDVALTIYCICTKVPFEGTAFEGRIKKDWQSWLSFALEIMIFFGVSHLCLKRYKKANSQIGKISTGCFYISLPFYYLTFGIFLLIYYVLGVLGLSGKKISEAEFSSSSNDTVTVKDKYGKEHKLTPDGKVGFVYYYKDEKGNNWQTRDGKEFTQKK